MESHQVVQFRVPNRPQGVRHSGHLEEEPPPKRLLSGPYLYCAFAVGILLVIVGTFLTAHAYVADEEKASVVILALKYIGPVLVVIGGLSFFGIAVLCGVAFHFNKDFPTGSRFWPEERYSIGGSTFYGDGRNAISHALPPYDPHSLYPKGVVNPHQSGLNFIAETIVEDRRRKNSKRYSRSGSTQSTPVVESSPSMILGNLSTPTSENQPNEAQLHKFTCLDQEFEPNLEFTGHRNRSYSLLNSQKKMLHPTEPLRRNVTLTQSASAKHLKELRQTRALTSRQISLPSPPELEYKTFSSLKRKRNKESKDAKGDLADVPKVYQLPSYSPDIIQNLIRSNSNSTSLNKIGSEAPTNLAYVEEQSQSIENEHESFKAEPSNKGSRRANLSGGSKKIAGVYFQEEVGTTDASVVPTSTAASKYKRPLMGVSSLQPEEKGFTTASPTLGKASTDGSLRKQSSKGSLTRNAHSIDQEGSLKKKKKLRKKRSSTRSSKASLPSKRTGSDSASSSSRSSSVCPSPYSSSNTSIHLSAPPPNTSAPPSPAEAEASVKDFLDSVQLQQADNSFKMAAVANRLSVISEGSADGKNFFSKS